jgi:hypothetical protein
MFGIARLFVVAVCVSARGLCSVCVCACLSSIGFYFLAHFSKIHYFFTNLRKHNFLLQKCDEHHDNTARQLHSTLCPPVCHLRTRDLVRSVKYDCSREDQTRQRKQQGAEQQEHT